jgi:hypothetical protein
MGHAACMSDMRNTKFQLEILVGRGHLDDLSIDGRILLK